MTPRLLGASRGVNRNDEDDPQSSSRLFEAVFAHAPDAILVTDDLGRTVEANPAACLLTGYSRDELLAMPATDLVSETRTDGPEEGPSGLSDDRERGVLTIRRKDGELIATECRTEASIQPGVHLSVLTDLTDRRQILDALHAKAERYRRFFEEDLTGDCLVTPEGEIKECNPAFARIFGFASPEQAQRTPVPTLFPERQVRRRFLCEMRRAGRVEHYEAQGHKITGETVYLVANVVGSFDADGELVDMRAYLIDDTERRRTEQQLLQAQKMDAVGRLAGGVAHDFNNLITAISGYSDLCLASIPEDLPVRDYLEEIKRAGDRGATLAGQLLAYSRMQVLKPNLFDLNTIVAETESMLRRLIGEDIYLTTELSADLPRVEADPGQIGQVIVNLAVNARDAMPRGGRLTLATDRIDLGPEDAEKYDFTPDPGSYVRLSVQDTGSGMDANVREHVFEPFFTTKAQGKGTGLGLSMVFGIVKQSGGYIVVDSAPGSGTRFEILLPEARASEPGRKAPQRSGERESSGGGRETILVVEDEAPLRRLLVQILLRSGYTVIEASGGREALATCRELSQTLDLVVTDVVMPDMGGPALAEELAVFSPATAVLFISGYPGDTVVRRGDLTRGRPFLQKPFDQETFLGTVRTVLDGTS